MRETICCQVYKVGFVVSRSLDGISRYHSVNFPVFVFLYFCLLLSFLDEVIIIDI